MRNTARLIQLADHLLDDNFAFIRPDDGEHASVELSQLTVI